MACPNGSEKKPGVPDTFWLSLYDYLPEYMHSIAFLTGKGQVLINANELCSSPPPTLQPITDADLLDPALFATKMRQNALANEWFNVCQCKSTAKGKCWRFWAENSPFELFACGDTARYRDMGANNTPYWQTSNRVLAPEVDGVLVKEASYVYGNADARLEQITTFPIVRSKPYSDGNCSVCSVAPDAPPPPAGDKPGNPVVPPSERVPQPPPPPPKACNCPPGAPGAPGAPGKDGRDGVDGKDGELSLDEMAIINDIKSDVQSLFPVLEQLSQLRGFITPILNPTGGELFKALSKLEESLKSDPCDPNPILQAVIPVGNSGSVTVPGRILFATVTFSSIPTSKVQSGNNTRNVLYGGWFQFGKDGFALPREHLDFERSLFVPPCDSCCTLAEFCCTKGGQASVNVYYKPNLKLI